MLVHKSGIAGKPALGQKIAKDLGGTPKRFTIELDFHSITETQQAAVIAAKERWEKVVVGGVRKAEVNGEKIDGLLIVVEAKKIDGKGHTDGRTRPDSLVKRPKGIGRAELLPAKGVITFDIDDLKTLERDNQLVNTALHEIGHVLGIGTIWESKGLLKDAGSNNPTFIGPLAMKAYGNLLGSAATPVPVENIGSEFSRDCHWRDSIFGNELMTSFGDTAPLLSLMTIMSLEDLGYKVNPQAFDFYNLPFLS